MGFFSAGLQGFFTVEKVMFSSLSSEQNSKEQHFYGYSLELCYQYGEVYVTNISADFNGLQQEFL